MENLLRAFCLCSSWKYSSFYFHSIITIYPCLLPAISLSGGIQRGIRFFQEIPPQSLYVSPVIEQPMDGRHTQREQFSVYSVHLQPHIHRIFVRKFPTSYAEVDNDVGELVNFFIQLNHPKKIIIKISIFCNLVIFRYNSFVYGLY